MRQTLLRVGLWPKRLLLYRTDEPFTKLKVGHIEILGAGQQVVAFGRHPGTGRSYDWPNGDTPLDVPLTDLPKVDRGAMDAFLAETTSFSPNGRSAAPRRPSTSSSTAASDTTTGGQDTGPVREGAVVVDGRDGWLSSIAYHEVWDALDRGVGVHPADVAARVWTRFAATTELSRPKQGGCDAYGFSDAAHKVGDKLRLHAGDALPSRNRAEVAPEYAVPSVPVSEARRRLDAEIADFAEATFAWHRDGRQEEPPKLALRATVGLGKSTISRRHLMVLRDRLRASGLPHRILVFVASHALAEEAAEAWEETGAVVAVVRGYEREEARTGRQMCRNLKAVKAAIANRRDIHSSACGKNLTTTCRYFIGCPKQENRRMVGLAEVVIAPYDAMFQKLAGASGDVGIVVVDEACWQRAPRAVPGLTLGSLMTEFLSQGRAFGSPLGQAARAADLAALRQQLRAVFEQSGPGPLRRAACLGDGLDAASCRSAITLEEKRLKPRLPTAGLDEDGVQEVVQASLWNERVYAMVDLWTAIETFLEGDAECCPTIRVGDFDPTTGDGVIHCSQLRSIEQGFAVLPCLHLDATFRSPLATPVLGAMREVCIDAAAPHMAVTLIPGPFGKTRLADGLEQGEGQCPTARPGSLLWRCVDYVRLLARAHAPQAVLVVTNKGVEPVFSGLPHVATAHFNAVAGIDAWKDIQVLIVLGRPLPSDHDVAPLAGVHLGANSAGGYQRSPVGLWLRDGSTRTVRVLRHEDPLAEVMRGAICDDELIQVIGRGRGVNRTADNPLDVHILADVALPLVHDRLVPWEAVAPGIFERMLLDGIAVDSPTDAVALHPLLLQNEKQAQKSFERGLFKRHFPYNIHRGMSLKSARYRRPGRGRSWQTVWWLDGTADEARSLLEQAGGPLAGWSPN